MKDTLWCFGDDQHVELYAIGEENVALLKEFARRLQLYNPDDRIYAVPAMPDDDNQFVVYITL